LAPDRCWIGGGGDEDLRITEKRRLAMAAAAMKQRMMTLSIVLVLLFLPREATASRVLEDSVATAIVADIFTMLDREG
jgi:hypothetical protein